jgi:predicted ATPase/class 3 adenylate cyclase
MNQTTQLALEAVLAGDSPANLSFLWCEAAGLGKTSRVNRPSGTVTFLFSDIEGSSRLWESDPAAMGPALERHDTIMRECVERHEGFVFKTVGDEFCVAFATPTSAASAALDAQRALAAENWPTSRPVAVRMAVHTGASEERDGDYFGPTLNRAARLMSIGHGGQVLVSGACAQLLGDTNLTSATLSDLGEHRLRDLGRPEHVFQLAASGLTASFPPLRSLDNPELANNLPALLSPFIGRHRELSELRELVKESRLVTITGAGGAGKTRLAMQAAAELLDGTGDGVWLVELAPLADEMLVPIVVGSALGLKEGLDVDPLGTIIQALTPQNLLIVLDNCEHLIEAVAKFVDAVVRSCPHVRLLATSREPLGVDGERVYRMPSMALPDEDAESLDEILEADATDLFVSRAGEVGAVITDSQAPLVASICRRLDGIPLAMELAAARLSSMSLTQLSDRLDQRFRLLTGGSRSAMARQQTLQALIDWSYGLLTSAEQSVLQRLSVFSGGFELDAAEAVAAGGDVDEFDVVNLLHSLVEKSLVVADQGAGSVRYRLLETIRQYGAAELLRVGGDDAVLAVRDRHYEYFRDLGERSVTELHDVNQLAWLARLDAESENIRAALTHLSGDTSRSAEYAQMIVNLATYLYSRGAADVIPRLEAAIDHLDSESILYPRATATLGQLTGWLLGGSDRGAVERVLPLLVRGAEVAERLDDPDAAAFSFGCLAMFRQYLGDAEGGARDVERSLEYAERSNDVWLRARLLAWSLNLRITRALGLSIEDRERRAEEILEVGQRTGDRFILTFAYGQLSVIAIDLNDHARSEEMLRRSIQVHEELGDSEGLHSPTNNLALAVVYRKDLDDEALEITQKALRLSRRGGFRQPTGDLIFVAAVVAARRGEADRAAVLLGATDELRRPQYESGVLYTTPDEDEMLEEATSLARAALGDQYDQYFARGQRLSVAESCELALGRRAV